MAVAILVSKHVCIFSGSICGQKNGGKMAPIAVLLAPNYSTLGCDGRTFGSSGNNFDSADSTLAK